MTRTTDTFRSTVDRAFANPFGDLWENTTEVTRFALDAYMNGLTVLVEQQQAAQRASQQWLSSIINVGSAGRSETAAETQGADDKSVRPARAASGARSKAAKAAPGARAGSTRRTARADKTSRSASEGTSTASGRSSEAGAQKRPSPAPERRSTVTSISRSALADAVGPALAKWTPQGYDTLTVTEVTEKLPQFSQQELREVETYEKAHQARLTILQRIDSLRGQEPVPGYDGLTVPEIETQLAEADAELAARIRDYERPHKGREGVLNAAEAKLPQTGDGDGDGDGDE